MVVERTSFLVALASLVAGGAGGYLAGERGLLSAAPNVGTTDFQPLASRPASATAPVAPPVAPVIAAPACDDGVGTPAACPAPGYPSEEGGCGALPTKRCQDFEQTMKPRVAENAVACLTALNASQRCDANRLNLCGHLALMNACPEPVGPSTNGAAPDDDASIRCASIAQSCSSPGTSASMRECRATLAGLTTFGRDQLASCMKAHCADKGLVGCEAVVAAR